MSRYLAPLFFLFIGVVFFIGSIRLPNAAVGNPDGLRYFPLLISGLLIVFSIVYFISEIMKRKEDFKDFRPLLMGRTPILIIATIILMIIYTNIFDRLGFLISTILFLGSLLFIINGRKKWLANILVTVIFSVVTWYVFGVLLQVSLP